jgi:hypothetical protein
MIIVDLPYLCFFVWDLAYMYLREKVKKMGTLIFIA